MRACRAWPSQSDEPQVDALLDAQQPARLPALDIVVQDFELRGRRLGRLEIEARNRVAGAGRASVNGAWAKVQPGGA